MVRLPRDYRSYTGVLVKLTALAIAICIAVGITVRTLRREALPAAANVKETYLSYYSPTPPSSQEKAEEEKAGNDKPEAKAPSPSPTPKKDEAGTYVITVHSGKIGVFQKGEREPFLTADVDVYLLPEEDIRLLKKGIPAETLAEARVILEDYQ